MTVYEALVQAQHEACEKAKWYDDEIAFDLEVKAPFSPDDMLEFQHNVDRAYLLGVAIDNLPADVASREV